MNLRVRSAFAPAFALVVAFYSVNGLAQNAFRCDQDGKTVYSDKPCPAGKVVAPAQDSAEQKAASKQANDQMRKDANDLNRRLSEREKLEAQERAAARKAAAAEKAKEAKEKRAAAARLKANKAKTAKKAAAAKKSKKNDNKVSSTS